MAKLLRDSEADPDFDDYIMEGKGSTWIEYKGFSIYILPDMLGIRIEVYERCHESDPPLASLKADYLDIAAMKERRRKEGICDG